MQISDLSRQQGNQTVMQDYNQVERFRQTYEKISVGTL